MYKLFLISILFFGLNNKALAAGGGAGPCTSPSASEGTIMWISASSKVMVCNGTWFDTSNGALSSCVGTAAGTIKYQPSGSKRIEYCDGTDWISTDSGNTDGSCAGHSEGEMTYDAVDGHMKFCGSGVMWYIMLAP
jgi:hypothetical protein